MSLSQRTNDDVTRRTNNVLRKVGDLFREPLQFRVTAQHVAQVDSKQMIIFEFVQSRAQLCGVGDVATSLQPVGFKIRQRIRALSGEWIGEKLSQRIRVDS